MWALVLTEFSSFVIANIFSLKYPKKWEKGSTAPYLIRVSDCKYILYLAIPKVWNPNTVPDRGRVNVGAMSAPTGSFGKSLYTLNFLRFALTNFSMLHLDVNLLPQIWDPNKVPVISYLISPINMKRQSTYIKINIHCSMEFLICTVPVNHS